MANDIRILEWNADGLQQRQHELQTVMDIQKIDICLISETHFTRETYLKLRGYQVYHTTHPSNSARGGSAVIVKQHIYHHEEFNYQTEEIQATAIKIKTTNRDIVVAAAYFPPRYKLKKNDYLHILKGLGNKFILGEDFNAKHTDWGSRLITTKGRELMEAIKEAKCNFHSTGKPTYWPSDRDKTPDLLDFFISKNISVNFINLEEGYDLVSDHSPILLTMSDRVIRKKELLMLTNHLTDWDYFREILEAKMRLEAQLQRQRKWSKN